MRAFAAFVSLCLILSATKGFAMQCVNDDRYVKEANIVADGTVSAIQNMLEVAHGGTDLVRDIQENGVPYELVVTVKTYSKGTSIGADSNLLADYEKRKKISFWYPVKNGPSPDVKKDGKITGIQTPQLDLQLGDRVTLYIKDYAYTHADAPTTCALVKN